MQSQAPTDARFTPVTSVRGSLLVACREALRELGLYGRYIELVPARHRTDLDSVAAGEWLPVELARVHFIACDKLQLSRAEVVTIGRMIFARIHSPVYATGLRLAGAAGLTPTGLAKLGSKMWGRRNDGGQLLVVQSGARAAELTLRGYTLADIPFVAAAWQGVIAATMELVARRVEVSQLAAASDSDTLAYRCTWA